MQLEKYGKTFRNDRRGNRKKNKPALYGSREFSYCAKGSIGVQEDSQEHAAFAAYVAGKGPCPIDIDELDMTDVREGQAFLEKTIPPGKADNQN